MNLGCWSNRPKFKFRLCHLHAGLLWFSELTSPLPHFFSLTGSCDKLVVSLSVGPVN